MRSLIGIAVLGLMLTTAAAARAQDDAYTGDDVGEASAANFQTFYDALAPYGQWVNTPDYGYVWRPSGVEASWRPYTHGRWVWTSYGWTWVADEAWGWGPYHYGRWVEADGAGWSWVPDYTWGPAWVSFRFGPSYVGWTPLPPGAGYRDAVYDRDDSDLGRWCFVNYDAFAPAPGASGESVYRSLYGPETIRARIWRNTQPAVAASFGGGLVYGPTQRYVEERVGRPVAAVTLHATVGARGGARLDGHELTVVAPVFHGVAHPFGGVNRTLPPTQVVGVGHLLNSRGNAVRPNPVLPGQSGGFRPAPVDRPGTRNARPSPIIERPLPVTPAQRTSPLPAPRPAAPASRPAPALGVYRAPAPRPQPVRYVAPTPRYVAPRPAPAPVQRVASHPAPRPAPVQGRVPAVRFARR